MLKLGLTRWLFSTACSLLVAFLCGGCKTPISLQQDPAFHLRDLESGKLAIGAIAGLGNGEYYLAPKVSIILIQSLKANAPQVQVCPLEEAKKLLDGPQMDKFLSEFSKEGELDHKDLKLFLPLRDQTRYVLLVQVSGDEAFSMRARSQWFEHRWSHHGPATGEYRRNHVSRRHRTASSHWVQSTFFICDLETLRPVWIAGTGSNVATEPEEPTDTESLISSADVMRTITQSLLQKLPR